MLVKPVRPGAALPSQVACLAALSSLLVVLPPREQAVESRSPLFPLIRNLLAVRRWRLARPFPILDLLMCRLAPLPAGMPARSRSRLGLGLLARRSMFLLAGRLGLILAVGRYVSIVAGL